MSKRPLIEMISKSRLCSIAMGILGILMGVFFIWYVRFDPDACDSVIGFTFLGIFIIAAGIFILALTVLQIINDEKQNKNKKKRASGAIRRADTNVKHRIMLEARYGDMTICYRRVKITNELVINGKVYDEYRAVLEFEHVLSASYGGHTVEAGYDEASNSYISVNGIRIAEKRRLL